MDDSADELELQTPGLRLAALAWGPPDGAPVLGLHGWLDNGATMYRLAPLLDSCRIVSVDLPGHGRSDHRRRGQSYHFVDLVPTIFDAADALGWDDFSILGHSMGAGAALLAAGTRPERIHRLGLVDGIGPWSTPPEETPAQLADALDERDTLLDKESRRFEDADQAIRVIAEMYGLSETVAAPMVRRSLVEGDESDEGECHFSYDLMLRATSPLRLSEPQVLAFLRNVEAPTRLVRPENGWPVDEEDFARRTDAVEPLEVERIQGPHHAHLSNPGAVADALGDDWR